MTDIIQLPLTKAEFHYVQHCIALYEAIEENDEETCRLIISLLRQNTLTVDVSERNALALKMNDLSKAVFQDSYFYRGG